MVEHITKHNISVSLVYQKEGASSRRCKLRRTKVVCLGVGEKVKRRRIGRRLLHLHEKFKLWLIS